MDGANLQAIVEVKSSELRAQAYMEMHRAKFDTVWSSLGSQGPSDGPRKLVQDGDTIVKNSLANSFTYLHLLLA